jgi:hypothetical protein
MLHSVGKEVFIMSEEKKSRKGIGGRKNKYFTNVQPRLDEVIKWCEEGLTEAQICQKLDVAVSSFNEYKNKYSELLDVLKKGKAVADDLVEQALYKSAIGYEYEEDALSNSGKVVKVKKYSKPNQTAQIFWLKNRRKDQWRDKHDVGLEGNMDLEINLGDFEQEFNK